MSPYRSAAKPFQIRANPTLPKRQQIKQLKKQLLELVKNSNIDDWKLSNECGLGNKYRTHWTCKTDKYRIQITDNRLECDELIISNADEKANVVDLVGQWFTYRLQRILSKRRAKSKKAEAKAKAKVASHERKQNKRKLQQERLNYNNRAIEIATELLGLNIKTTIENNDSPGKATRPEPYRIKGDSQ